MEEFRDFESFMEKIAPWGHTSGICKVIPPVEWSVAAAVLSLDRQLIGLNLPSTNKTNIAGRLPYPRSPLRHYHPCESRIRSNKTCLAVLVCSGRVQSRKRRTSRLGNGGRSAEAGSSSKLRSGLGHLRDWSNMLILLCF
jgi:hypothetical protein